QQFVDDEMLRVPMVADQVLDATWANLQEGLGKLSARERSVVADLLQAGLAHRRRLVEAFSASVRQQVNAELAGTVASAPAHPGLSLGGLALLDEGEIAADVETSRAIEAIKSECEHELRELATYVAALAGDMDVARDHNPFRAETYARAMWAAAETLPMGHSWQVSLMRHAVRPLAQVLRKVYAGACARLETAGVEPAAYRTFIVPAGPRTGRSVDSWQNQTPDLRAVRETMPTRSLTGVGPRTSALPLEHVLRDAERALHAIPADAPASMHAQLIESQRVQLVRHARSTVDQQLIELLGRLFEAMLSDRRLPRDVRSVLARLQPSALRIVLRDHDTLDNYDHPVWAFMDQLAHLAALYPLGSVARDAVLRVGDEVVDALAQTPQPDIALYQDGLVRLRAEAQTRLQARLARAGADIQALQALESQLDNAMFEVPSGVGPMDVAQLDTVPADLLDKLPTARTEPQDETLWLTRQQIGDWTRMFCGGRWMRAQLLWQSRSGEIWLFGAEQSGELVALRRRALERLLAEGLAAELHLRSMLRSAAVQMLRRQSQAAQETAAAA
ncbi:MAG: DUF1631 domain-containing protein, partial [Rubrivivax sp.]|nr:DUF1631 domain-containing protein [Rubrivivax sp.]